MVVNRKNLKRAFWASLARLIGVGLGAGAGSLIHQLVGGGFNGWGLASVMAIVSFILMLFAEYEKESQEVVICIICMELIKQKMTISEAERNLGEMVNDRKETIDNLNHYGRLKEAIEIMDYLCEVLEEFYDR